MGGRKGASDREEKENDREREGEEGEGGARPIGESFQVTDAGPLKGNIDAKAPLPPRDHLRHTAAAERHQLPPVVKLAGAGRAGLGAAQRLDHPLLCGRLPQLGRRLGRRRRLQATRRLCRSGGWIERATRFGSRGSGLGLALP